MAEICSQIDWNDVDSPEITNNLEMIFQSLMNGTLGEELLDDNMIFVQKLSQLLQTCIQSPQQQKRSNLVMALSTAVVMGDRFRGIVFDRWLSRKALESWLIPCIRLRDDPEVPFYALSLLNMILDTPIHEKRFEPLNHELVCYLLDLTVDIEYDLDQHNLFLEGMKSLAGIYDTLDEMAASQLRSKTRGRDVILGNARAKANAGEDNPVIYQIHHHPSAVEFGQNFIKLLNRGMDSRTTRRTLKLMSEILRDDKLSMSFFYWNDLKVLIDILMRDFDNFDEGAENDELRLLCLRVLGLVLKNTEYSTQEVPHRPEDIRQFLKRISESDMSESITIEAQEIFSSF
ncbi:hypothetical protein PROFUN_07638 [Planoprotostelium fungivorum]|uniref:SPIN90/Ldb17 leucine-rich domain-containing protein n=1 Tax=Planoprotostelium fungivorum TaxID=1890364 RepID=A0A2P6NK64_9EUKA|nr:hypothetical protein PROFUN_07638 [Planoprotostelium fungivorum]